MQIQIVNLKTFFIAFLWVIVVCFFMIFSYHSSYLTAYSYTDIFWLKESIFGYAIAFCAMFVVTGFSKKEKRKRFYKKQQEILNLFEEKEKSISLHQILSKSNFSKDEIKGILEHLVEKNILIPSFSEE